MSPRFSRTRLNSVLLAFAGFLVLLTADYAMFNSFRGRHPDHSLRYLSFPLGVAGHLAGLALTVAALRRPRSGPVIFIAVVNGLVLIFPWIPVVMSIFLP